MKTVPDRQLATPMPTSSIFFRPDTHKTSSQPRRSPSRHPLPHVVVPARGISKHLYAAAHAVARAGYMTLEEIHTRSRGAHVVAARRAIAFIGRVILLNKPSYPDIAVVIRGRRSVHTAAMRAFAHFEGDSLARRYAQEAVRELARSGVPVRDSEDAKRFMDEARSPTAE